VKRRQHGGVSAKDLAAEKERRLREDPDYRALVEQAEAERAAQAEQRRLAVQPVLDDLRSLGVEIGSLWDLYKQPEVHDEAMPVLLSHLQRDYSERTLDDVGNALPSKPAAKWWDDLADLYITTASEAVRDRLAAALSACARQKHYQDLLGFVADRSLGASRVYFLRPINRIGNRISPGTGRAAIEATANDPILVREATAILEGRGRSR
jgi:hypothetical protein